MNFRFGMVDASMLRVHRHSPLMRYGMAALSVALAALAGYIPAIGERALLICFLIAILNTTLWFGTRTALFAFALSIATINFLFLYQDWVSAAHSALLLNLIFCVCAIIAISSTITFRNAALELRRRRRDLLRAQAIAQIGNWRMDVLHNKLYWSEENHRIFGISKANPLTLETFINAVHPEDRKYVMHQWKEALRGKPYDIEHRIVVAGNVKWVRERAELEFAADGSLLSVFGTTQEITGQKQTKQNLSASESRFKLLSDISGRLLATEDPQAVIEELAPEVIRHVNSDCFFNFLRDKAGNRLRINVCGGIPAEEVRSTEWLDYNIAVSGSADLSGERLIFKDIQHCDDPRTTFLKRIGMQAYACHPLIAQGQIMGTLSFGSRTRPIFSVENLELMGLITDQVAMAMQRIMDQDSLAASRRRYVSIVESAIEAIICVDNKHRILVFNAAAEKMFGCPANEAINASVERFIPDLFRYNDDEHNLAFAPFDSAGQAPHTLTGLRANGEKFPLEAAIFQTELDGEILSTINLKDISERMQAEKAIQERLKVQEQMSKVAATVPGVICSLHAHSDGKRYLQYMSPGFEKLFGVKPQEMAKDCNPIFANIHPDDLLHVNVNMSESALSMKPWRYAFRYNHPNKGEIWIEAHFMPAREAADGILWYGYTHDITERKVADLEKQKFYKLAENSKDFIGMCDMNLMPFYVNPAGIAMVGLDSLKQAVATPVPEFFFPEDRPFVSNEFFPRVLREGNAEIEIRFRHFRNGPALWMVFNVFKILDSMGTTVGLATVSRDITARKENEEALRESERANRYLAGFLENSDQPFAVGYSDGSLEHFNSAFEKLTGYNRDELSALSWGVDLTPEEWRAFEAARLEELRRSGKPVRYEKEYQRKNGTRVPIELLVHYVDGDTDQRDYYYAFITDLTERKAAETTLRENMAKLRLAVEAADAGLWDRDLTTGSVYFSPDWKRQIGYAPDEFPNRWEEWEARLHPEDREQVQLITKNYIAELQLGYELEYRLRHRDGSYRWIHTRGALLRDSKGQPCRLLGLNLDITAYKNAEERNERRDLMEAAFRHQIASQTAAAIAHELNQPLTALASYSEVALHLLQAGNQNPEKLAHVLENNVNQAQRAGQVTRQLMHMLQKGETVSEPMDINAVVHDATDIVMEDINTEDFPIELHLAPDLPPVQANQLHVEKVLVNLLRNGVEAMVGAGMDSGRMTVTTGIAPSNSSMALVTVRDTGKGVDPDTLKDLFRPFFTTKSTGLGMGLAISRSLIEAHGGNLWAEQDEYPGLSFHFTLPFVS